MNYLLLFMFLATTTIAAPLIGGSQLVNPEKHSKIVCEVYDDIKGQWNVTRVAEMRVQIVSGIKYWIIFGLKNGEYVETIGIYQPFFHEIKVVRSYPEYKLIENCNVAIDRLCDK